MFYVVLCCLIKKKKIIFTLLCDLRSRQCLYCNAWPLMSSVTCQSCGMEARTVNGFAAVSPDQD